MSDNAVIHSEAFHMLKGEKIGSGMSRVVWDCPILEDCVIKVEDSVTHFQNVIEWETWQNVRGTMYEKWFAPCRWISHSGSILIMEKTKPALDRHYPDRMPKFLCDFKKRNYGLIGNRLVCHDYGLLLSTGLTKATWRDLWSDK
ncbi:MAG: hypothetical protein JWO08_3087 [Verrucomicrobiaceae bacterium]|nr:hypothetical protein [Verrucomicrobiaceae bacterium]